MKLVGVNRVINKEHNVIARSMINLDAISSIDFNNEGTPVIRMLNGQSYETDDDSVKAICLRSDAVYS